jgi:hypothetical protein
VSIRIYLTGQWFRAVIDGATMFTEVVEKVKKDISTEGLRL